MPSAARNRFADALANCSRSHFWPNVGEAVMRIERMIVAVLVSVLALFVVQGTASASSDGMPYDGTTVVHH